MRWQGCMLASLAKARFHDSEDMLAGALDIYKCFYQIVPLLVDTISTLRGFPGRFSGSTGA